MKKAVVIGGTRGFGKDISVCLQDSGFSVVTIGRTKADLVCDVTDQKSLDKTLEAVKKIGALDMLVCTVGYARCIFGEPSDRERFLHYQANVGYIRQAVESLSENVRDGKILTIGSKWGLEEPVAELQLYGAAKRELIDFTQSLRANVLTSCYCVPSMKTPGCSAVEESFVRSGFECVPKQFFGDPKNIASKMVRHAVSDTVGGTFLVSPKGVITAVYQ